MDGLNEILRQKYGSKADDDEKDKKEMVNKIKGIAEIFKKKKKA